MQSAFWPCISYAKWQQPSCPRCWRIVTARTGSLAHWLCLFAQVPEEDLPEYKPREHLKGVDAELVERVKAEIMAVHGDALASVGLDGKAVLMEGRRGCGSCSALLHKPVMFQTRSLRHISYCHPQVGNYVKYNVLGLWQDPAEMGPCDGRACTEWAAEGRG